MGITSLQVCMDYSSDWLQQQQQQQVHDDDELQGGSDNIGGLILEHSSSSPITSPSAGEDMLTCSRTPLMERRLRPPHDQSLKCPRCESTHTKFCYYNNYSLSQPRYFCKTCRRYWTKGGTLRNIPVGGGCRKNKKQVSNNSKKQSNHESSSTSSPSPSPLPHSNTSSGILMSTSPIPNYNQFDFHTPIHDETNNNSYNGVNLSIDQWHEQQQLQQQQQQACNSNAGKDSFGYNFGGLGSWTGLMNGYGSSATNPLV
ncbi:hypothetical protein RD792_004834 [Penstemon davidsonii]|uniref:Dof zinc finger protein n=1 Tax=Penstemon davidsonii TaxID=160366 RepID=A0ABR0DJ97_9LAMI|nr:hypothetical protein RD792_004834 [Penstemon davidsonii]